MNKDFNSQLKWGIYLSFSLFVFFHNPVGGQEAKNKFSDVEPSNLSPDKACTILDVPTKNASRAGKLFFQHNGQSIPLNLPVTAYRRHAENSYGHNVDVFWSPDSSRFVIIDWINGRKTDAYLFSINEISKPVCILPKIRKLSKESALKLLDLRETIILVKKWNAVGELELFVSGGYFAAPSDFRRLELTFQWNLKNKVKCMDIRRTHF